MIALQKIAEMRLLVQRWQTELALCHSRLAPTIKVTKADSISSFAGDEVEQETTSMSMGDLTFENEKTKPASRLPEIDSENFADTNQFKSHSKKFFVSRELAEIIRQRTEKQRRQCPANNDFKVECNP